MRTTNHRQTARRCLSAEGHEIAYDVAGQGPALLLLHGGFVHDRTMWHTAGYVAALSAEFRMILPDLRGHGASPHFATPGDYAIERVLGDLHAVLAAEHVERVLTFGYSFGAIVGLRLSIGNAGTAGLVLLGGAFGDALPEAMRLAVLNRLDEVARARALGRDPGLSADEQSFIARADLGVVRAAYTAFANWPRIEPRELSCPTAFIAGSENPWSMESLRNHSVGMEATGVVSAILPGFSHEQELTEIDVVLSVLRPFLGQYAEGTRAASR